MRKLLWRWVLIKVLVSTCFLTGCAARYSSTDRPCAQADGCWVEQRTPLGWAYCRKENGENRCILER